jgi:hypothetical protein
MANYTDLIRIHTTSKYTDQYIDFGVYPAVDKLTTKEREELLEVLERLASRLKNNEYPFSI